MDISKYISTNTNERLLVNLSKPKLKQTKEMDEFNPLDVLAAAAALKSHTLCDAKDSSNSPDPKDSTTLKAKSRPSIVNNSQQDMTIKTAAVDVTKNLNKTTNGEVSASDEESKWDNNTWQKTNGDVKSPEHKHTVVKTKKMVISASGTSVSQNFPTLRNALDISVCDINSNNKQVEHVTTNHQDTDKQSNLEDDSCVSATQAGIGPNTLTRGAFHCQTTTSERTNKGEVDSDGSVTEVDQSEQKSVVIAKGSDSVDSLSAKGPSSDKSDSEMGCDTTVAPDSDSGVEPGSPEETKIESHEMTETSVEMTSPVTVAAKPSTLTLYVTTSSNGQKMVKTPLPGVQHKHQLATIVAKPASQQQKTTLAFTNGNKVVYLPVKSALAQGNVGVKGQKVVAVTQAGAKVQQRPIVSPIQMSSKTSISTAALNIGKVTAQAGTKVITVFPDKLCQGQSLLGNRVTDAGGDNGLTTTCGQKVVLPSTSNPSATESQPDGEKAVSSALGQINSMHTKLNNMKSSSCPSTAVTLDNAHEDGLKSLDSSISKKSNLLKDDASFNLPSIVPDESQLINVRTNQCGSGGEDVEHPVSCDRTDKEKEDSDIKSSRSSHLITSDKLPSAACGDEVGSSHSAASITHDNKTHKGEAVQTSTSARTDLGNESKPEVGVEKSDLGESSISKSLAVTSVGYASGVIARPVTPVNSSITRIQARGSSPILTSQAQATPPVASAHQPMRGIILSGGLGALSNAQAQFSAALHKASKTTPSTAHILPAGGVLGPTTTTTTPQGILTKAGIAGTAASMQAYSQHMSSNTSQALPLSTATGAGVVSPSKIQRYASFMSYPVPRKAKSEDKRNIKMPVEALLHSHALLDHDYCWHAYYEVAINSVLPEKPKKEKKEPRERRKGRKSKASEVESDVHSEVSTEDLAISLDGEDIAEVASPLEKEDHSPDHAVLQDSPEDASSGERKKRKYVRKKPRKSDSSDTENNKEKAAKQAKAKAEADNKVKICGSFQDHFIYFATKKIKSRTRNLDKNKNQNANAYEIAPGDVDFYRKMWVPATTSSTVQVAPSTAIASPPKSMTDSLLPPQQNNSGGLSPGRKEDVFELVDELYMMSEGGIPISDVDTSLDTSFITTETVTTASFPPVQKLPHSQPIPQQQQQQQQDIDEILKSLTAEEIKEILNNMNSDALMSTDPTLSSILDTVVDTSALPVGSNVVKPAYIDAPLSGIVVEKLDSVQTEDEVDKATSSTAEVLIDPVAGASAGLLQASVETSLVDSSVTGVLSQGSSGQLFDLAEVQTSEYISVPQNTVNLLLNDLNASPVKPSAGEVPTSTNLGTPLGEKLLSALAESSPIRRPQPQSATVAALNFDQAHMGLAGAAGSGMLDKTELFPDMSGNAAPETSLDSSVPELTTVTMYWNTFPALMINNEPHVRLVDIHKQALPAKDTGLLKKRCVTMGLAIKNCSDMQRDFLIRYARASPSKSTVIVSKTTAEELIGFYVNPQPKIHRSSRDEKLDNDTKVDEEVSMPSSSEQGGQSDKEMKDVVPRKRNSSLGAGPAKKQKIHFKLQGDDVLIAEVPKSSIPGDKNSDPGAEENDAVTDSNQKVPTDITKPKKQRKREEPCPSNRLERPRRGKRVRYDQLVQGSCASDSSDHEETEKCGFEPPAMDQSGIDPSSLTGTNTPVGDQTTDCKASLDSKGDTTGFCSEFQKFILPPTPQDTALKVKLRGKKRSKKGFGRGRIALKSSGSSLNNQDENDKKMKTPAMLPDGIVPITPPRGRPRKAELEKMKLVKATRDLQKLKLKAMKLKAVEVKERHRIEKEKMKNLHNAKRQSPRNKKFSHSPQHDSQKQKLDHCYSFYPEDRMEIETLDDTSVGESCEVQRVIACDGEVKPCTVAMEKQKPLEVVHRDAVHRDDQRGRSQDGDLYLHLYKMKNSQCVQCTTCCEFFTVRLFKQHFHDPNDPDMIVQATVTQKLEMRSVNPTTEEEQKWENYTKRKRYFENQTETPGGKHQEKEDSSIVRALKFKIQHLDQLAAEGDQSKNKVSTRHSTRERKKKQLYPMEKYTYSKLLPNYSAELKKEPYVPELEIGDTRYGELEQRLLPSEMKAEVP
ncbi:uncharacterized protein LOC106158434 isoform X1 [Lingula anatina]|uniref:Uncharacterized protein LOC106158434 isoform X1 n=2 Tax=Lingula anatina TaxID=7574 RepID=A0A1S3HUZ8_LINAN|nr:uncharacterized protein LOC106158434 isoform X1 [Lingula anatina]|eukprot:XP_013389843.1 uncharacterized protein LOC106158434 isoform X1 [Lingula anatina]